MHFEFYSANPVMATSEPATVETNTGEDVTGNLKDWELTRLGMAMSQQNFSNIALRYLGLSKVFKTYYGKVISSSISFRSSFSGEDRDPLFGSKGPEK